MQRKGSRVYLSSAKQERHNQYKLVESSNVQTADNQWEYLPQVHENKCAAPKVNCVHRASYG